jgi:protein-S-isoprenylcysteine O-methyltransferase Ste14
MSYAPAFEIGLWNAWIFMIIYPLQWLAVVLMPKHIAQRVSHPSEVKKQQTSRIIPFLTEAIWIIAMLYSIFLPLRINTPFFYIGLCLFLLGFIILISASWSVIKTPQDLPFTRGLYRFSRHPMYVSMIIVYLGVSIAAVSWLFLLITIVTIFLQQNQMTREEKYCCEKFGQVYSEYLNRTPRWIGLQRRAP